VNEDPTSFLPLIARKNACYSPRDFESGTVSHCNISHLRKLGPLKEVTMKKARIALLAAHVAAASWLVAGPGAAQDMSFSLDETDGATATDSGDTPDSVASDSGDVIGDLAGGGAATDTTTARDTPEHVDEAREEIYAVQQIYALRLNRVEISPSYSATLNDPFISHNGIGLGLNYWFTNVLAVGANFIWYQGL